MAIMTGDLQIPETYNPALAVKAQEEHCKRVGAPMFAPSSGYCFHCGQNIYSAKVYPNGFIGGISVEQASRNLITGCPFCHISFAD